MRYRGTTPVLAITRRAGRSPGGGRQEPAPAEAGVEWHPGELHPRVGFIVANLVQPGSASPFYNQSDMAEEGKGAIKWTRLSCRSLATNAVRLQLRALAYVRFQTAEVAVP